MFPAEVAIQKHFLLLGAADDRPNVDPLRS